MFPTVEVRWFFSGKIPGAVRGWFVGLGDTAVASPPPRTDYYLHLPGNDALGVKWREEQIEAKQRYVEWGRVDFAPQASGVAAHWRKYSFALGDDTAVSTVSDSPDWIAVRKARALLGWRLAGGQATVAAPADLDPVCQMELGQVTAVGAAWWTLAFEAPGNEDAFRQTLLPIVQQALASPGAPALPAEASFAYPRWLLELRKV